MRHHKMYILHPIEWPTLLASPSAPPSRHRPSQQQHQHSSGSSGSRHMPQESQLFTCALSADTPCTLTSGLSTHTSHPSCLGHTFVSGILVTFFLLLHRVFLCSCGCAGGTEPGTDAAVPGPVQAVQAPGAVEQPGGHQLHGERVYGGSGWGWHRKGLAHTCLSCVVTQRSGCEGGCGLHHSKASRQLWCH